MSSVQDRLTAAVRAAAATIPDDGAPPLRLPAGPVTGRRRWPGRALALAVPASAAVALTAIVVAVAVLHGQAIRSRTGPAQAGGGLPPRYFVALGGTGRTAQAGAFRLFASVVDGTTGKVIATVRPPGPDDTFVTVTGAADDRTFVLAVQNRQKIGPALDLLPSRLYELRIDPAGSGAHAILSPLPIPALSLPTYPLLDTIALSPDGSRLAVMDDAWPRPSVRVYDVTTGRYRGWHLPADLQHIRPPFLSPSWQADGRYLALSVRWGHPSGTECLDCVRLLDTAAAGGNLLTDSKLLIRPPALPGHSAWTSTLLAPDGNRILRSAIVQVPGVKGRYTFVSRIYDYLLAGTRVVRLTSGRDRRWDLLWASKDGQSFIVWSALENGRTQAPTALRYSGGRWTKIPLPPDTLTAAW
jgi:hypothetical protein